MDEPELVTVSEAARIIGITEASLNQARYRGKFPVEYGRKGIRPYWERSVIEAYAKERSTIRRTVTA